HTRFSRDWSSDVCSSDLIVGCTVFGAVSGSSAATLTTVGKMSIPELRKRNYPEHMVVGTLAGAATLGLMIPPSLTLIVYGVTVGSEERRVGETASGVGVV